jgi:hypothetical protein
MKTLPLLSYSSRRLSRFKSKDIYFIGHYGNTIVRGVTLNTQSLGAYDHATLFFSGTNQSCQIINEAIFLTNSSGNLSLVYTLVQVSPSPYWFEPSSLVFTNLTGNQLVINNLSPAPLSPPLTSTSSWCI